MGARRRMQGWLVGLLLGLLVAGPAGALEPAAVDRALRFSQDQLARTSGELVPGNYPIITTAAGTWNTVPAGDMVGWTQGFFPGSLWYIYGLTRDPAWAAVATQWTTPLRVQRDNRQTHDLGFKFMPSYGLAFALTMDPSYKEVILSAANALASRYRARVGVISCCDWNPNWHLPVVIDTMMNLELLFWASQNGGQTVWRDMALSHALKTVADLVRADGSTFQVVDYDPATGARLSRGTYQGYSSSSTWARGQAWAVYGFTMAYRYTRDSRMLDAARRVTDFYLSRLPADSVPNWDFNSPSMVKDSSAAAIVASALLELHGYETDPIRKQRYLDAAIRMLESLTSSAYLAQGTISRGILLHGVGYYPRTADRDKSLVYGDYYFVEALVRYRSQFGQTSPPPPVWYSRASFSSSVHSLGTNNTGSLSVEFDVTPLRPGIDSVVGYADSSTTVTAYSSLAMLIRMNPTGAFDVRNGGGYAALTRVTYATGQTYHVRMVTDLAARRYSVWITPPGGAEVLVADRYAFRTDAPFTDDLGKVSLKSGYVDNEFKLERHTITPLVATPVDEPSPPEVSPPAGELPEEVSEAPEESPSGGCYVVFGNSAAAWVLLGALAWCRRSRPGQAVHGGPPRPGAPG